MTEDATGNRADNNERRVHFRSGYDLKSARAMYQYFFGRQYDDKSIDLEITKLFCEADGLVSLPEALVLALMLRKDFHRGRSRSRAADIFPELKAQEKAAARKRFKARVDEDHDIALFARQKAAV
jgi:hypothetical protein